MDGVVGIAHGAPEGALCALQVAFLVDLETKPEQQDGQEERTTPGKGVGRVIRARICCTACCTCRELLCIIWISAVEVSVMPELYS